MKKLFLLFIEQIVYKFAEKTAPGTKYCERNYLVATAAIALHNLAMSYAPSKP